MWKTHPGLTVVRYDQTGYRGLVVFIMILFNGTVENTFGYKWFADIMKVVLVFLIIFPDIVKVKT